MKIKNKLIACAIPATMIMSSVISATVAYADEESINIGISDVQAVAGEEFTFDVTITNVPKSGVQCLEFGVKYDSDIIEILSCTADDLNINDKDSELKTFVSFANTSSSEVGYLFSSPSADDTSAWITSDGVLCTMTAKVKDTANAGDVSSLEIVPITRDAKTNILAGYVNGTSIHKYSVATDNGSVTVKSSALTATIYGDANCDGTVDIADAVAVAAYVGDAEKNTLTEQGIINADVQATGNGLNAGDTLAIQQYLARVVEELPA